VSDKRCPRCRLSFPRTAEYWNLDTRGRVGVGLCLVCRRVYNARYKKTHKSGTRIRVRTWPRGPRCVLCATPGATRVCVNCGVGYLRGRAT